MTYIINGKVVEKKPFSIIDFVWNLWRLMMLFFHSIFSSRTVSSHTDQFRSGGGTGGGRPGGANIHRIPKPTLGGGCSGSGCAGGSCGR